MAELDAAIEAAARVLANERPDNRGDLLVDSWDAPPVPTGQVDGWRDHWRQRAAAALAVAAPLIRADERTRVCAELLARADLYERTGAGPQVVDVLREVADLISPGVRHV